MSRLVAVLSVFAISLIGCYSSYQYQVGKVNKFKDGESWHFLNHADRNQLSLLSAETRETVKSTDRMKLSSYAYIHILCKYGVSSLSNDCVTMFSLATYPKNYGLLPYGATRNISLVFDGDTTQVARREFTFYQFNDRNLMLSPHQVDEFLSLLTIHEGVTVNLEWSLMHATRDTHHSTNYIFRFNKTGVALSRFKSAVVTEGEPQAEKSIMQPHRSAAEVMANYI